MATATAPPQVTVHARVAPVIAVAGTYISSFLVVFGFPHLLAGFALDDSWIHQDIARNLARFGTLGFIPGQWSSGTTSYLWTFLLAAQWKHFPGMDPVAFCATMNCLFLVAIGICLLAIARADGMGEKQAFLMAIAPALDGNLLWLGTIGMESVLFIVLSLATILFAFRTGARSTAICSLCLGALILTRPEGICLALLVVPAFLIAKRPPRHICLLGSTAAFAFSISLLLNRATSDSWLPMTYAGRRWLFFGTGHITTAARAKFAFTTVYEATNFTTSPAGIVWLIIFVTGLTMICAGLKLILREHRWRLLSLTFWSATLFAAYFVMLPSNANANRYQPMLLLLRLPLLLLGISYALGVLGKLKPRIKTAILTVIALAIGAHSLMFWRSIAADGVDVVHSTHGAMASFLDTLPGHPPIAAFDIGRIAYTYPGHVTDLGGLVDTSFLAYLRQDHVMAYIQDRHLHYFVWPSRSDGSSDIPQILNIDSSLRVHLDQVAKFCAPFEVWHPSHEATANHSQCQILYRIK